MSFSWNYILLLIFLFYHQKKSIKTTPSIRNQRVGWIWSRGRSSVTPVLETSHAHSITYSFCFFEYVSRIGSLLDVIACTELFLLEFPGGHSISIHRITSVSSGTWCPGPCSAVVRGIEILSDLRLLQVVPRWLSLHIYAPVRFCLNTYTKEESEWTIQHQFLGQVSRQRHGSFCYSSLQVMSTPHQIPGWFWIFQEALFNMGPRKRGLSLQVQVCLNYHCAE